MPTSISKENPRINKSCWNKRNIYRNSTSALKTLKKIS